MTQETPVFGDRTIPHPVSHFVGRYEEVFDGDSMFARLKWDVTHMQNAANDVIGKNILCGIYGDRITIAFRNWVRGRIERARSQFVSGLDHPCAEVA